MQPQEPDRVTASYVVGWLRWVVCSWLPWAFARVGYWVRPYDMLADRRRWFWQAPQHCGGPILLTLCDCPWHPCEHNPRRSA